MFTERSVVKPFISLYLYYSQVWFSLFNAKETEVYPKADSKIQPQVGKSNSMENVNKYSRSF